MPSTDADIEAFVERLRRTPKLCIVHIPKTGGSTLVDGLRRGLRGQVHQFYSPDQRAQFNALGPGSFAEPGPMVVSGHFGYGRFRDVLAEDFVYLAFVRDPVERLVSFYRHGRESPAGSFVATAAREQDFSSFLGFLHRRSRRNLRNLQTRLLAPTARAGERRYVRLGLTMRGLDDDRILVVPTNVADAVIPLVCDALGAGRPTKRSKVSDPADPVVPSPDDVARIEATNRHDRALYEWACRRQRAAPA